MLLTVTLRSGGTEATPTGVAATAMLRVSMIPDSIYFGTAMIDVSILPTAALLANVSWHR